MSFAIKFIVILIALAWPLSSQARGGSKSTGHKDITITKTTDKSSPTMMESKSKTKSSLLRGNNSTDRKGGRYLGQ